MALADEINAFSAYVNGHAQARDRLCPEELGEYEADMAKAHAVMETAWLERLAAGPTTPAVEDTHRRGTPRPPFDPDVGWTTTNILEGW